MTDGESADTADPAATIRQLPETTVERIAAGEVITRPVRVVTELVDNALDADATSVEIRVSGSGTEQIRVADDGSGMTREDARRAVQRHTTSKLKPGDDPREVSSLGFRGEALAAIADAGRLDVTTCDGNSAGTQIRVKDADNTVSDAARAQGTTVTVQGLFSDRPARAESLAGAATEFGRISRAVADYALARPDTRFRLTHDDSETLSSPGTEYTDAILAVYDRTMAQRATDLAVTQTPPGESDGTVDIEGIAVLPSITRANRTHVRVAVNGRPVSHDGLQRAVQRGYGSLLSTGRNPVAAVNVAAPAGTIDPNVHPAKTTVDIRNADRVTDAVETAVSDALTGADADRITEVATDLDTQLEPVKLDSLFADVVPLGSFRELYVLCEADEELLVIDQHAAHERVNFERLTRAVSDATVATARLDPAETIPLAPETVATVEANRQVLADFGFDTDTFGRGTIRLRSVPAPFGRAADVGTFRDAVDTLAVSDEPDALRREVARDIACHHSVRAGDSLESEQTQLLLDRLDECEQPFHCPHGRPTVLSIDEATLAAGFDRRGRR